LRAAAPAQRRASARFLSGLGAPEDVAAPAAANEAATELNFAPKHRSPAARRSKRIRQHLNPLSSESQKPMTLGEDWLGEAFSDPTRPLTIDVGSAMGGWVLESAVADSQRNFLGLEIRPAAVEAALIKLDTSKLGNAHFFRCNANVDIGVLLMEIQKRNVPLERILIQFPDPQFKKKHHKRRVVTPELAQNVAKALRASPVPGAFAYLVSDVYEAADHMREVFRNETDLVEFATDGEWTPRSPLAVATEREKAVMLGQGDTSTIAGHAYRAIFSPRPLPDFWAGQTE